MSVDTFTQVLFLGACILVHLIWLRAGLTIRIGGISAMPSSDSENCSGYLFEDISDDPGEEIPDSPKLKTPDELVGLDIGDFGFGCF